MNEQKAKPLDPHPWAWHQNRTMSFSFLCNTTAPSPARFQPYEDGSPFRPRGKCLGQMSECRPGRKAGKDFGCGMKSIPPATGGMHEVDWLQGVAEVVIPSILHMERLAQAIVHDSNVCLSQIHGERRGCVCNLLWWA